MIKTELVGTSKPGASCQAQIRSKFNCSFQPTFLHIDINSYFATLLQQETPALRGRPLVVVKDVGRQCVIAASKEAKAAGLKTGSRLGDCLHVNNLAIEPCNFEMFLATTKRLKTLFESLSPEVEIFSLDEAFINFTHLKKLYSSPFQLAEIIQHKIKSELGEWVTCNVGIGRNRFLAKMIGEVSSKGSIQIVTSHNEDALLAKVEFSDVCGVGLRLAKRLLGLGIYHPLQINFVSDDNLLKWCGPFWQKELRKMGQGDEPLFLTRINREQAMKSISRSITGYRLCDDEAVIRQTLYNLSTEVIHKVRRLGLVGRQVGFSLDGHDRRLSNYVTLKYHIRHLSEMFKIIYDRLYQAERRTFPVIKFRVFLSLLEPWNQTAQLLWPDYWQNEKVSVATDLINQRYGLFTVTSGLLVDKTKIIRPEVTGFLGDKQFQFLN